MTNFITEMMRNLTTETKPLRKHKKLSEEELQELELIYAENQNPSPKVKKDLASKYNRSERFICGWFSQRRIKDGIRIMGKRDRKKYSEQELMILEEAFNREKYPSFEIRRELAEKIGCPELKIYWWFNNKRALEGTKFPVGKRSTKSRTKLTEDHKKQLEKIYLTTQYLDTDQRRELAEKLQVGEKSVYHWFRNKRNV